MRRRLRACAGTGRKMSCRAAGSAGRAPVAQWIEQRFPKALAASSTLAGGASSAHSASNQPWLGCSHSELSVESMSLARVLLGWSCRNDHRRQESTGTVESRTPRSTVVAIYESRAGAEVALIALRQEGLDVNLLTVLGISTEEQALRFTATGIPANRAVTYARDVKSGKFLVLAGGSAQEIGRACALLGATGPSELTASAA